MKKYVSIDIGGTAIKYGVINSEGQIVEKEQMPTEAWRGGPEILNKVIGIVETYKKIYTVSGICISTAGMVDVEKGEIFYAAPLIPNYAGTKFKQVLEEKFQIPCEVENDVNCAGLAESVSGVAKQSKVTLCLTVGTGIGGCIIIQGKIFRGYSNSACEVGYMNMGDSDFQTLGAASLCLTVGTGIGGCIIIQGKIFRGYSNSACEVGYMNMGDSDFQTLGAASILTKKVAERKKEPQERWNGYRIFEHAKKGDAVCCQAIDEMVDILGKGIANICYVLNPEIIVLGGGIMAQQEFLKEKIEQSVKRYLVPSIAENTKIAFAKHKNDAGMLGAFYHFTERHSM